MLCNVTWGAMDALRFCLVALFPRRPTPACTPLFAEEWSVPRAPTSGSLYRVEPSFVVGLGSSTD